ncbi:MAG TPA: XdhC family protein [Kofleriaceae bacterium]|nr:XdhC family protein [Kofleriaceae bacterium]
MTERSIVEAAERLRRHGEPYLVATVVCVQGAAYRRPGGRMLLTRFRWIAGAVTGGCLEGDLTSKAWSLTRDGSPALLTYDSLSPELVDDDIRAAFGLGCDGIVEVLIERTGQTGRVDPLAIAGRCLRTQRRGAVATVFRSDGRVRLGSRLALVAGGELEEEADRLAPALRELVLADMHAALETGASLNRTYTTEHGFLEVLIEAIVPPPRLFVFGTGHDAVPLVQLARTLGWDVVICAADERHSTRDRFTMADEIIVGQPELIAAKIAEADRAVAVVMTHDLERDRESLALLLGTRARYIGVLGPRIRTQRLIGDAATDPRIHAPVGLQLGAETPQELALSITSEIMQTLAPVPPPARETEWPERYPATVVHAAAV